MIDAIKANCKLVEQVIEKEINTRDEWGCLEKLDELVRISAMAINNRANAKLHLRECILTVTEGIMGTEYQKELPASTLNNYIQAKCGDAEALYEKADRQEKRLGSAIDAMRTIISLLKTDIEKSS